MEANESSAPDWLKFFAAAALLLTLLIVAFHKTDAWLSGRFRDRIHQSLSADSTITEQEVFVECIESLDSIFPGVRVCACSFLDNHDCTIPEARALLFAGFRHDNARFVGHACERIINRGGALSSAELAELRRFSNRFPQHSEWIDKILTRSGTDKPVFDSQR